MLAIRMQRTGRKGHAQFRLIVQDKRFSPTSGRVVAQLGSYDPHSKVVKVDTEKAAAYLKNGAQPTDRVAMLLKKEGVKLPTWVKLADPQKRSIKNQDKLRRNRPADAKPVEVPADGPEPVKEEAPAVEADSGETAAAEPTDAPTAEVAETAPETTPEAEAPASDEAAAPTTEEAPQEAVEPEATPEPESTAPEPETKA
jgi:small subunit ribosomal protein S16